VAQLISAAISLRRFWPTPTNVQSKVHRHEQQS
jgi:hypothetical protein